MITGLETLHSILYIYTLYRFGASSTCYKEYVGDGSRETIYTAWITFFQRSLWKWKQFLGKRLPTPTDNAQNRVYGSAFPYQSSVTSIAQMLNDEKDFKSSTEPLTNPLAIKACSHCGSSERIQEVTSYHYLTLVAFKASLTWIKTSLNVSNSRSVEHLPKDIHIIQFRPSTWTKLIERGDHDALTSRILAAATLCVIAVGMFLTITHGFRACWKLRYE